MITQFDMSRVNVFKTRLDSTRFATYWYLNDSIFDWYIELNHFDFKCRIKIHFVVNIKWVFDFNFFWFDNNWEKWRNDFFFVFLFVFVNRVIVIRFTMINFKLKFFFLFSTFFCDCELRKFRVIDKWCCVVVKINFF